MKVAVLASPEDGRVLIDLLRAFAGANIEAYGLKLRELWHRRPRAEFIDRLQKADHFLLVVSPASAASSWASFAVGYGVGRGLGLALFLPEASLERPRFLADLPAMCSIIELQTYYQAEKAEWLLLEERRMARSSLLEMGISCHAESLAQCVRDGDTKAVELFLRAGFIADARDKHGVPLLCLAARHKHLSIAQLLLERGANLDLQSEDRGYSPLMDAVHAGAAELSALLLSKGADPDLQSKDGQTAVVVAVGKGDAEAVRLLLDYGADPDIPDKLGLSARKYASLFKSPAMASFFGLAPEGRK